MLKKLNINEYTVLLFNQFNKPLVFNDIISENKINILKVTFD